MSYCAIDEVIRYRVYSRCHHDTEVVLVNLVRSQAYYQVRGRLCNPEFRLNSDVSEIPCVMAFDEPVLGRD